LFIKAGHIQCSFGYLFHSVPKKLLLPALDGKTRYLFIGTVLCKSNVSEYGDGNVADFDVVYNVN